MILTIAYIFSILIVLASIFLVFITLLPLLHGAPYVPSSNSRLEDMIKISDVKKGDKVAELGSGNGKVVIAFALLGTSVDGFEINPFLVLRSKMKIKKLGLEKSAHIYWKSMWRVNYSKYDMVSVYGITYIMKDLEKKLQKELQTGAKVVSNYFVFPTWKPKKSLNGVNLYIK